MTNKSTKKALLSAVLSLIVCIAMLVGSTFAWFTDSVTSANNIIKSGNLDVTLEWMDGKDAPAGPDDAVWKDASTEAIFNYNLWEPGYTTVRHIKIGNEGSLALKYKVVIEANGTVSDLTDVIDVYYFDPAQQIADRTALAGVTPMGTLTSVLGNMSTTAQGELAANTDDIITIALKMKETAGNEYMNKQVGDSFAIKVLATQLAAESDSFDNQYDANASYPGEANSVSELLEALKGNMNVKLGADINLSNTAWTPIASYSGVFDGAGHTISGLKGENGLFDNLSGATVKNLNLANVDIDATSNHTGAVAGYIVKSQGKQTVIDNVTVSGTVNGGDYYVGGLVGADSNYDTVIKNSTNNATVVANGQQVGGIVGYATRKTVIENCVNNGNVTGGSFVGGIIGMAAGDDDMPERSIIVKNCVNNGDVAETATGPAVTWQGGVGGIIGNVGRAAGDAAVKMLNFYIIDCDVKDGQAVYGQKHNVLGGHENLLTVYVGDTIPAGNAVALQNAVAALGADEDATFFLTDGNYDGDVKLTVADLGADKTGDIAFVAVPETKPVLTGLTQLGFYEKLNNASAKFNANITYDGITFEQAEEMAYCLRVENVGSVVLTNCTFIGGGEYGIASPGGNNTGVSKITNCTFINSSVQPNGNFGTGLVIEGCTFNESVINVQGGNGVTVKGCEFTNTVTDAHNNESFYVIRSNAIPMTVTDCTFDVDSTVSGTGVAGSKGWGVFVNRNNKDWTVTDCSITMSDAALAQTALKVGAKLSTGKIYTTNLKVNGVAYDIDVAP